MKTTPETEEAHDGGIKPTGFVVHQDSSTEALNAFLTRSIKGSTALMTALFADDEFYRTAKYAHVSPEDARRIVLYGYARQVKKSCYVMIAKMETITGPEVEYDTEARTLLEAMHDEQQVWVRKLMETLIDLINFSTTDDGHAYRAYLSQENRELFHAQQRDFREFFGAENQNVGQSILSFGKRVDDDLAAMNLTSIWFLEGIRFSTEKSRFINALAMADPDEILMLGSSYQTVYSRSSQALHAGAGSIPVDTEPGTLRANSFMISMFGLHIIDRIAELLNVPSPNGVKKILALGSDAPKHLSKLRREFEVGDLVLAYGDLAEVLERKEGKYGYTAYKVKYLSKPPIPSIMEDTFASEYVQLLMAKKSARAFVERSVVRTPYIKEGSEILKQNDEWLYDTMRSLFTDLANHGLLLKLLQTKPPASNGVTPPTPTPTTP